MKRLLLLTTIVSCLMMQPIICMERIQDEESGLIDGSVYNQPSTCTRITKSKCAVPLLVGASCLGFAVLVAGLFVGIDVVPNYLDNKYPPLYPTYDRLPENFYCGNCYNQNPNGSSIPHPNNFSIIWQPTCQTLGTACFPGDNTVKPHGNGACNGSWALANNNFFFEATGIYYSYNLEQVQAFCPNPPIYALKLGPKTIGLRCSRSTSGLTNCTNAMQGRKAVRNARTSVDEQSNSNTHPFEKMPSVFFEHVDTQPVKPSAFARAIQMAHRLFNQ